VYDWASDSDDKSLPASVRWTLEYVGIDFIERLRLHQQAIAASTFKPDLPNTLLNFPTNYPKYSDDKHTRQRNR
jgi:hypothetical protein